MKKLIVLGIMLGLGLLIWIERQVEPETPGEIAATLPVPDELVAQRPGVRQARAGKQILFGDLHVHTTYSVDAHAWSVPIMGGEGVHPPAEACDYARFCSGLDFWGTTEHAESLTPRLWQDLKNIVRQCNEVSGDADNPDMVSFLGWEWTQMGNTPESHYGHKNVILRDTADELVPARPIGSGGAAAKAMREASLSPLEEFMAPYMDWGGRHNMLVQQLKMNDLRQTEVCAEGVPVRELPADCVEFATTPRELFDKLNDWDFPALVIPHGNTWGFYTPPGSGWEKQLTRDQHDPARQTLIEVFSGHGNSEEYRSWREIDFDAQGQPVCPAATPDYLPGCVQAGRIIQARCEDPASDECAARVDLAERAYLAAGRGGHLVVPEVTPEDWLDAGQCRDCYLPAFNYRPLSSTQYALALSNFDEPGENESDPLRFRFGFIASSDNHAAQPGTGFKETGRHGSTEAYGQDGLPRQQFMDAAKAKGDPREAQPFDLIRDGRKFNFLQINESERAQSYFYTGGLVAVHSAGRNRDAIWNALQRREVYATSGERMLLWFDLLGADGQREPMGSILEAAGTPSFEVRALGAFEQAPGCPDHSVAALGPDNIEQICRGECYNPTGARRPISQIEVVRIRPQAEPGESVDALIEDPWLVLPCEDTGEGCTLRFSDPEFLAGGREHIYYVRAIQPPTPTVNAGQLRCETGPDGECLSVDICHGDSRTNRDDDCLAPAAERAWSSPIYLTPASAVARSDS